MNIVFIFISVIYNSNALMKYKHIDRKLVLQRSNICICILKVNIHQIRA